MVWEGFGAGLGRVWAGFGWVWTSDSENNSTWFPKVKLLLQEKPGSWKEVLMNLKDEINNL